MHEVIQCLYDYHIGLDSEEFQKKHSHSLGHNDIMRELYLFDNAYLKNPLIMRKPYPFAVFDSESERIIAVSATSVVVEHATGTDALGIKRWQATQTWNLERPTLVKGLLKLALPGAQIDKTDSIDR